MSDAIETFRDSQEHHKENPHSPRWIPIAAAVLAVLAAVSGFLGNLRATASLTAKNDAVIATTRAADAWNEYESDSIKQHIYEAAIDAGRASDPGKLKRVVSDERTKKGPLHDKAVGLEHDAEKANGVSEHLLFQHEAFEVATALFEVAIVLVSVTALVTSRILPIFAGIACLVGLFAVLTALLK